MGGVLARGEHELGSARLGEAVDDADLRPRQGSMYHVCQSRRDGFATDDQRSQSGCRGRSLKLAPRVGLH